MFNLSKKIKQLELRLCELEKSLQGVNNSPKNQEQADYKEVLDQWLNGKSC